MRVLLHHFMSLVFPPRKSAVRVSAITSIHPERKMCSLFDQPVTYLLPYKDPNIQALITEVKFHAEPHAVELLSVALKTTLSELESQYDYIIPIPLSAHRERQRGYNQVALVLKNAGFNFDETVLKRSHKPPQTSLKRSERITNVEGVFTVPQAVCEKIAKKRIVLIDDVVTTGATMVAAKAALLPHQPTCVDCMALAH